MFEFLEIFLVEWNFRYLFFYFIQTQLKIRKNYNSELGV